MFSLSPYFVEYFRVASINRAIFITPKFVRPKFVNEHTQFFSSHKSRTKINYFQTNHFRNAIFIWCVTFVSNQFRMLMQVNCVLESVRVFVMKSIWLGLMFVFTFSINILYISFLSTLEILLYYSHHCFFHIIKSISEEITENAQRTHTLDNKDHLMKLLYGKYFIRLN